jgi:6-pyruvoyl-tetrahydropterin synthase
METNHLLRRTFSAGHAQPECGDRPHGHDYVVEVVVREFPFGAADALHDCLVQIDGRNLPEMLPGVPSTCAGIASWIFENMRMTVKIVRVTVWQSGVMGAEVIETDL